MNYRHKSELFLKIAFASGPIDPSSNVYAMVIAILQASGSGKSRSIMEIGLTTPLLYLCHREDGETGFPRRTPYIIDHLMFRNDQSLVSDWWIFSRCAAFFCVASTYSSALLLATLGMDEPSKKKVFSTFVDAQFQPDFWRGFTQKMEPIEAKIRALRMSTTGDWTLAEVE